MALEPPSALQPQPPLTWEIEVHAASGACAHTAPTHVSVVQSSLSSQAASLKQHSAMG
jgi:hypothetical protein